MTADREHDDAKVGCVLILLFWAVVLILGYLIDRTDFLAWLRG